MNYRNIENGLTVIIKSDGSFAILGEGDHDSVTDPELWDMAEGKTPEGWERVI